MRQVLEGIRIADFSHVMAGPYATHLLRLLGAEVIKIETPGRGDAMRYYGADRRYDGMAPAFIAVNAGKKSIVLDLKNPDDLAQARALVGRCDVLVENFRPGVMQRLGLDYAAVKALNPSVVYCSVSGYGQSGPRRDWPAIDNIVQATSGMMSLGGDPDGPPMRVGFPVVDTLTGQTAAFAIMSALLRRERSGEGDFIDVAMFDATIAFMASAVVPFLVTGQALARTGNTGYSGQPTSALFKAKDGHSISLGVVQQHQFELLARLLEQPHWLTDPLFRDPDTRRQNAVAVQGALSEVLATRDAAEWEQLLSAAGIPCGMVRDISQAMSLPALDERALRIALKVPGLPGREDVAVLGPGFVSSQAGRTELAAPPTLGQHSEEIRDWLRRP
ncbi:MAG: CoA transferase [Gammaproteobacteria bacterium]|jgi:CoA:oxalate CoA-transferase|nr:CoA transferase [Gammaproteobacteria bacterium]